MRKESRSICPDYCEEDGISVHFDWEDQAAIITFREKLEKVEKVYKVKIESWKLEQLVEKIQESVINNLRREANCYAAALNLEEME